MQKEKIEPLKETKEKKLEEVYRYELDPEKKISVVIKKVFQDALSKKIKTFFHYEPVEITIEKEGKDILSFNKIIPSDYNIVFISKKAEEYEKRIWGNVQNIWGHDSVEKLIVIPRKWKEKGKDILALLHEIAHSLDTSNKSKEAIQLSEEIKSLKDIEDEKGFLKPEDKKRKQLLMKKYFRIDSQIERWTWAKALKIAREIKRKKNIDLLKPFRGKTPAETRKNFEDYIHGLEGLGEMELILKKNGPIELKGIFTTKLYKKEKFSLEHRKKIRSKNS